jgi:hypothetical protein
MAKILRHHGGRPKKRQARSGVSTVGKNIGNGLMSGSGIVYRDRPATKRSR